MSTVSFLLKKAGSSGKSLIILQFKYNGKKLVFSFGQSIYKKNWNAKKQRVKSNKQTTADGDHSLNDLLDNLQDICEGTYKKELKNGIPNTDVLKKHLIEFMQQNNEDDSRPTLFSLIQRFINNEIKHKGRDKTEATIKTYKTLKGHLLEFERIKRETINFETITIDFYYRFVDFLKKRKQYESQIRSFRPELKNKHIDGLKDNSVSKDIQILKVIMSEAVDLGYTNNLQFKHKKFAVTREETDAVFLTEKEIINLYQFDFSKNKKLERVRDLFVFGCFVGLRFSDFSNVKLDNIVNIDGSRFIKMVTQKTKDVVIIPCNPIVLSIFKKYDNSPNKLPRSISNQKFNDFIKEVCRKAGLTEKGRLVTHPESELCDCISSHSARRSFATNYYLQGFPTIDLMKITGHKTEKAFLKYIRITKLDAAKRLLEHGKKNWSEMMLKVAS
jgi:hypothetical protein